VFVTKAVEVLLHGAAVSSGAKVAVIVELVTVVGLMTFVLDLNASSGDTHDFTRGRTAEKMFAETPTPWKAGGSNGRVTSRATSTVTETFASTSTSGPRLISSFDSSRVSLVYGAWGIVALLLLPQLSAMLVDSFASKRGKFIDKVTSAFSLSVNSKPMGIEGLNARPSVMSASVTLTLIGSGVSVDSGKP
jgi:hypothetical protein